VALVGSEGAAFTVVDTLSLANAAHTACSLSSDVAGDEHSQPGHGRPRTGVASTAIGAATDGSENAPDQSILRLSYSLACGRGGDGF